MSKYKVRLSAAVAAMAVLALVPATASAKKTTITLSGSTTVAPLASQLAAAYAKERNKKSKKVSFRLGQGGSGVGINDVAAGRVTIGMSSRELTPADPGGLAVAAIARDAICVIVNKSNGVSNLSEAQVQAIFGQSGHVSSWSDIAGSNRNDTINVFARTPTSGTADSFRSLFGVPTMFSGASLKASNGLVQNSVKSNAAGVGYVSLAFISGVKPVRYKGQACTLKNAISGKYAAVRKLNFVTRGKATGEAKRWIKWIRTDKKARNIIKKEWVPLK